MKENLATEVKNTNLDNSELKNLPESCIYCAYRTKPSSALDRCTEYCKKAFRVGIQPQNS